MGAVLALRSWRWGLFSAILVGLLQDPVRKVLPGVPAYLTLSTVPIWLGLAANVLINQCDVVSRFLASFPVLSRHFSWLGLYLVIPAMLSLTYGRGTWQIALLGAFVYAACFAMILAGWGGWRDSGKFDQVMVFYALSAGLFLTGGVLEYFGWGSRSAMIGTEALDHVWVTHRTGEAVYMLSGLFRSPDLMGWHAITVFMFAFILAMRSQGRWRLFWAAIAIWGLLSLWVCGRRKMITMVPVFVGCYLWLVFQVRGSRRLFSMIALALLVVGIGWHLAGRVYHDNPMSRFYVTVLDEWDDQVIRHGFNSAIGTVEQSGFFGYGLGMSQQGVHNINADKPRLWQESGPSKLVAELGVPGAILFLILGFVFFRTAYEVVRHSVRTEDIYLSGGLFAVLVANLASAVVSAQVFGDPFIVLFLALLAGLLLSGANAVSDGAARSLS